MEWKHLKATLPLHKFVYDNLYTRDISKLADNLDFSYDLVLLIDVLEHFDKAEGRSLLTKILARNEGISEFLLQSTQVIKKMHSIIFMKFIEPDGQNKKYRDYIVILRMMIMMMILIVIMVSSLHFFLEI